MTALLDDILARLSSLPEAERRAIEEDAVKATAGMQFIPSAGAQLMAYRSRADILLYGGKPGGGKTSLIIGLALNEHDRSLIVRKQFTDLEGVTDNAKGIVGSSEGFVGGSRPKYHKPGGGVIHFQGMAQGDGIDSGKQGTPYDFIGVDEGAQLPQNSIRMLLGWNRTTKKGQRCRMVIASNPPLDSTGDWLVEFFGPWLDENHSNPAKPGELRWYYIGPDDKSVEVGGPEPVTVDGVEYSPHSRTFIPADVKDNPYIDAADYVRRMQVMPEPYRSILTSGNFMYARKDADFQVIPTDWVAAAQARWTPRPPEGMAMTAMAVDPAGGGNDAEALCWRYGGWYAPLVTRQGEETAQSTHAANAIFMHRRDNCPVVVDACGGFGGPIINRLTDNEIDFVRFNGADGSTAKTLDSRLPFANKRAEAWWRFREALDPHQEGGSVIALPPDPELRADLTAARYVGSVLERRGEIQIESKDELRKRLGRSPGKGDAAVMCLSEANKAVMRARSVNAPRPQVVMGHSSARRKR